MKTSTNQAKELLNKMFLEIFEVSEYDWNGTEKNQIEIIADQFAHSCLFPNNLKRYKNSIQTIWEEEFCGGCPFGFPVYYDDAVTLLTDAGFPIPANKTSIDSYVMLKRLTYMAYLRLCKKHDVKPF